MTFLLFSLPFAFIELIKKQSITDAFRSMISSLSMIPLFYILPRFFFTPLFLLSLANALFFRFFGSPLNIKLLKNIHHLPSLKDSLKGNIPYITLFASFLFATFYPLILTPPPFYTLALLPLLFLTSKKHYPYPYYLLTQIFAFERTKSLDPLPTPQNETFIKTSSDYPLEKITLSFSGPELFNIPQPLNKPHVVFIYLESFRSSSISKVAPYFSTLSKEGIYFSNFYTNASQTFKALFATLYGLYPSFGSDYTESSSPVLTLPLKGLPDFFKSRGYKNIFIKAGRHDFDRQGEFLKNHNTQSTFDEKDIKRAFSKAHGTSWGVHDEFMYTYLLRRLKSATSPLFIQASTVTNHHPFALPDSFIPKHGSTPFEKTMEYSDYALNQIVQDLKKLNTPIHLYIMGDHGYPEDHEKGARFSPSLDKNVTHVPFLILPIGCGKFTPQQIDDISSQVDILPTLMDIYNFKGTNSALGSSLRRRRKNPSALLLNESIKPISGTATKDSYTTFEGYHPLYDTLYTLYKEQKISSLKKDLKTLNFSNQMIPLEELQTLLDENPLLETLYLDNSLLIPSLDLHFPEFLKKITLDNNIMITDEDLNYLPTSLCEISIKGCKNLTDKSLLTLAKLPLKRISLTCSNFSKKGLKSFFRSTKLTHVELEDGPHLDESVFTPLSDHSFEEVIFKNIEGVTDNTIASIASSTLKSFLCDNCKDLSEKAALHLKDSSLEVLHLQFIPQMTDQSLSSLLHLPIHTLFISHAPYLTQRSIDLINTNKTRNLFCIDCNNLPNKVQESEGKQITILNGGAA